MKCGIYSMNYYSALKTDEILIHAKIWINLKNIMLREMSETQKDKYCIIPLP
jgi:hypothetical protein